MSAAYDLLSSIDVVDPYPLWQALLDGPPQVAPDGSFALITRLADCAALLRHPDMSSDHRNSNYFKTVRLPALSPQDRERFEKREVFLFRDPPVHTRLRRLVSTAFTPRRVEMLQPFVERRTEELLTGAANRGRIELVEDLAYPLPVAVISEMLGVPHEDHATFAGWSAVLAKGLDTLMSEPTPEEMRANGVASDEFRAYFEQLAKARRRDPRDDLMSALVAAEEEGDALSMDELISTALLLLVAGHETTVSLIGNAMLALLRVPGLLDRVRADPTVAEGVIEEVLRLDPPVQMTMRTALADVEVPGGVVKAGGTAVLLIAAAGRDSASFSEPSTFDPDRKDSGHLAFSGGIHYCLGAPLARLEGRVVVAERARRLVAPRSEELQFRDNRVLRGPSRLVLGYDTLLP
ncbi:MAG: cytochrome P450 [Mycobacteriales bacterium]